MVDFLRQKNKKISLDNILVIGKLLQEEDLAKRSLRIGRIAKSIEDFL